VPKRGVCGTRVVHSAKGRRCLRPPRTAVAAAALTLSATNVGSRGGTAGRRVAITDLSATIILALILINHLLFAIFMQVYQLLAAVRSGFVVDGKLLIKLACWW
jgi:hypothetical protein